MKNLFIALSILVPFNLIGQCPEFSTTITLTSQSRVDAFVSDFPNCEELNNDLIIGHFGAPESTDINNLTGLASLKRINGELRVRNVDLLESFEGLNNIEYVESDLVIGDNELLVDLNDFRRIDSIGGNFDIYNNPNLKELFEEDSIKFVGASLSITNNDTLVQISGFKELRSLGGNLEIGGNSELVSAEGFENLEIINGTLDIYDCPQLQNLNGFEMLTIIENGMEIRGTGITDLSGLNNLHQINGQLLGNSVSITDNDNLLSLAGLESLDSIQRSFFLTDNETLESITALSNLRYIGGRLSIRNSNLSDISALQGITPLTATVEIQENPNLIAIDQLPLSNSIDGSLDISDNNNLTDITSLGVVDTLWGRLVISDNISLSECNSLCPLLTIGFIESIVTIRDNSGDCETKDDLTLVCTTNTQEIDDNEVIQLFPNPADHMLSIKALSDIQEVLFYRTDGSIIRSFDYEQGSDSIHLNISDIQSGLYYVELVMEGKRVGKKFVKL